MILGFTTFEFWKTRIDEIPQFVNILKEDGSYRLVPRRTAPFCKIRGLLLALLKPDIIRSREVDWFGHR
jgi:hypothetical protein